MKTNFVGGGLQFVFSNLKDRLLKKGISFSYNSEPNITRDI